jgi:hypothetical protein
MPVCLREVDFEFEYAVRPYEGEKADTLIEFFEELYCYMSMGYDGYGGYDSYDEGAMTVNVEITREGINEWLGTPLGLMWIAQVSDDEALRGLLHRYLAKLQSA